MSVWTDITGGPKTTTTNSTTTPVAGVSNTYIYAGVALLGIALLLGVVWMSGGFKKKASA